MFRRKEKEPIEEWRRLLRSADSYARRNNSAPREKRLEPKPEHTPHQAPAYDLPANALASDIAGTSSAIWQNKSYVIITTICFTLLATLVAFLLPQSFEATNQIFIDPRSKALIEEEIVPTGLGRSSIGGDLLLLDSQIAIIQSDRVLRETLQKEIDAGRLDAGADGKPDFLMVDSLRKSLKVGRSGNSYVVGITVRDPSPTGAARIANSIVSTYIAQQSDNRTDVTRETTSALEARVENLRNGVRQAEARVEAYRAENNLIEIAGTGTSTGTDIAGASDRLLNDEQLRNLNTRLVDAKADMLEAEANYEALRRASATNSLAGATAEALASPVLGNLRSQLAIASSALANAEGSLGSRHPRLGALRTEVASIQRSIKNEIGRFFNAAKSRRDVARKNLQSLEGLLAQLTRSSLSDSKALVQLRELEREAASQREVFQALQLRAKQSGEQETLSNDSTRVISQAIPPIFAAFPNKKLFVAGGLFLGLTFGILLAWLIAIFSASKAHKFTPRPHNHRNKNQPQQSQWS
ncbi:MAG: GumC family protein [Hyphomicrobiales bacterium]